VRDCALAAVPGQRTSRKATSSSGLAEADQVWSTITLVTGHTPAGVTPSRYSGTNANWPGTQPLTQCAAVSTRSPDRLSTTVAVQKCRPSWGRPPRPGVMRNSASTAGLVPAGAASRATFAAWAGRPSVCAAAASQPAGQRVMAGPAATSSTAASTPGTRPAARIIRVRRAGQRP
jgi:hypothetical protein